MKVADILGGGRTRHKWRGTERRKRIVGHDLHTTIKLKEGGSLEGVGSIHIDEIEPTLRALEKTLGVKLIGNTLGSVGKKEFSGDIDIALKMDPSDTADFVKKLEDSPLTDEVQKSSVIMTRTKIVNYDQNKETDKLRTGYVQIDFMPSDDVDWLKTYYHAPHERDSKYKGALRNIAVAILAKYVNPKASTETTTDGRPMESERYMLSPRDGLVRVRRTPVPKKTGDGHTKQNKNDVIGGPWKTGDEISKQLRLGSAANLDSFETVFAAIVKNHGEDVARKVAADFARDSTVQKLGVPKELEKYL